MAEPFMGQLMLFGGNFAPYGWMLCQGQILPVQQYAALFSLLGTTYGGNGTSNFGLPDLRGRLPNGMGQGPGLSDYALGELNGVESVSLTQTTVPTHTHSLLAYSGTASLSIPSVGALTAEGAVVSGHGSGTTTILYNSGAPTVSLAPAQVGQVTGSGIPHNNMQPYLVVNWCIAYMGIYPTRP